MDKNYVVVRVLDIVWHPIDMEESNNSLPATVNRLGFEYVEKKLTDN